MFKKGLSWYQLLNITPVAGHQQYSTNNAKLRTTVVNGGVVQYTPCNTVVTLKRLVINAFKRGDFSTYINGLQMLNPRDYKKVVRTVNK